MLALPLMAFSGCGVSKDYFAINASTLNGSPALLEIQGPNPTDFSTQSINSYTYLSVTLANVGQTPATQITATGLSGTAFLFPGSLGAFPGQDGTCGTQLAPGATCQMTIGFVPIHGIDPIGTLIGTLNLGYFDGINQQTLSQQLTGVATNTPTLYIQDPTTLTAKGVNFGTITLQSSTLTAQHTLNLLFAGPPDTEVLGINFVPFSSGMPFSLKFQGCEGVDAMSMDLQSCSFSVEFAPTSVGTFNGQIVVDYSDGSTYNGSAGLAASFALSGVAIGPASLTYAGTSPATFGPAAIGSTVTNTLPFNYAGSLPATGVTATLSGTDAGSFTIGNQSNCTGSVQANCSVELGFKPEQVRSYSATLTLTYQDGAGNTISVPVPLTASGSLDLASSSPTFSFGTYPIGNTSTQTFTLTNLSTAPIAISGVTETGAYQASTTCGAQLAGGKTCNLLVTFAPNAVGTLNGSVTVAYVDAGGNAQQLVMTGSGTGSADVTVSATALAFGSTEVGNTVTQSLTLTNTAGEPVRLTSFVSGATSFQAANTGCAVLVGLFLNAQTSCVLTVNFTPNSTNTTAGSLAFSSAMTITYSNADQQSTQLSVSLSGTSTPDLVVSPSSLSLSADVGDTAIGSFSLKNVSNEPISLTQLPPTAGPFVVSAGNPPCTVGTLAAGATCEMTASYTPTSIGSTSSTWSVSYNDALGNAATGTLALTGTGKADLSVSPSPANFGSVPIGNTPTLTVTYTNTSGSPISLTSLPTLSGVFSLTGGTCATGAFASKQSCTEIVQFSPVALGEVTQTMTMRYTDAEGNAQTLSDTVEGDGTPDITISPASIAFGSAPVGNTETSTLTLKNVASSSVTLGTEVALTAPFSAGAASTCSAGLALAASGTCTLVVVFTPNQIASFSGTAGWNYTNLAGTATTVSATLSGKGTAGVTLSSTSLSFPSTAVGASSTLSVTVSNVGTSAVTLASPYSTSGQFSVTPPATGACPAGGTLAGGTSCAISVVFTPTQASSTAVTASFAVDYTDPFGNPVALAYTTSATAYVPASLTLTNPAAPYTFGNTLVNSSLSATFTLSNSGTTAASALTFTGLSAPFSLTSTPGSCAAGTTCQLTVKFSPTAAVTSSQTLVIGYSTGPSSGTASLSIPLSGTGVNSALLGLYDSGGNPITGQTSIGNAFVGSSPITANLVLKNTGLVAATSVAISLTGSAKISITSNGCGTTLAAGSSCTMTLTYQPSASGPETDTSSWSATYSNGVSSTASTVSPVSVLAESIIHVQFSANGAQTCALSQLGGVWCWGQNQSGQLGIGSADGNAHPTPTQVALGAPAIAVAVGYQHACAILQGGSLTCWGDNTYGQLGLDNTTQQSSPPATPINLGAGRSAVAVAAGLVHTCALLDDGGVKCWGENTVYGYLGTENTLNYGDGSNLMSTLPEISFGTDSSGSAYKATAISVNAGHSCALLTGGVLKCWGDNSEGELGQDNSNAIGAAAGSMGNGLPPINLGTDSSGSTATALEVSAGNGFTCARIDDGSLRCWGKSSNGNLGTCWTINAGGATVACSQYPSGSPISAYGLSAGQMGANLPDVSLGTGLSALSVSAGNDHVCAMLQGSSGGPVVKCWGSNDHGQLGVGLSTTATVGTSPSQMGNDLSSVVLGTTATLTGIVSGYDHVCAWFSDNSSECWGSDASGELGNGGTSDVIAPSQPYLNGSL